MERDIAGHRPVVNSKILLCLKPIVVRAAGGQEVFVNHSTEPQRLRNPDYSHIWE